MIDKIMKLIALTASPNENEARNAAFLACKMIREQKLEVVERDVMPSPVSYEDLFRKAAEAAYARPYQPTAYARPYQPPKQEWHSIRARFVTRCGGCDCAIDVGEQIWWKKDCKARCLICGKPKEQ